MTIAMNDEYRARLSYLAGPSGQRLFALPRFVLVHLIKCITIPIGSIQWSEKSKS